MRRAHRVLQALRIGPEKAATRATPGVQSIGSVVEVTPGDYFELIARRTSGATKDVAADELT